MQSEEIDQPRNLLDGVTFRLQTAGDRTTVCRVTRDALETLAECRLHHPDQHLATYLTYRLQILSAALQQVTEGARKPLVTATDFPNRQQHRAA
jgi:hypothetical protein